MKNINYKTKFSGSCEKDVVVSRSRSRYNAVLIM